MGDNEREHARTKGDITPEAAAKRESGEPGGGAGRVDEVGRTGVYPMSAKERPPEEAERRTMGKWGAGDHEVSEELTEGGSELVMRDGQLLGGLTAGPTGAPTIDIHGGPREHDTTHEIGNPAGKHANEERDRDREPDRG